jgi:hypothetical protein
VGSISLESGLVPRSKVAGSWHLGLLLVSTFWRFGMATAGDAGSLQGLGVVVGSLGTVDPDPSGGYPLGLETVNPEVLANNLTSGMEMGIHTSIALSFTSGLDFELSVATLSGFVPGLDPPPGLSEGDFSCLSSEPGALFADDCRGTQPKVLQEVVSCAQFSPSELITDIGLFRSC